MLVGPHDLCDALMIRHGRQLSRMGTPGAASVVGGGVLSVAEDGQPELTLKLRLADPAEPPAQAPPEEALVLSARDRHNHNEALSSTRKRLEPLMKAGKLTREGVDLLLRIVAAEDLLARTQGVRNQRKHYNAALRALLEGRSPIMPPELDVVASRSALRVAVAYPQDARVGHRSPQKSIAVGESSAPPFCRTNCRCRLRAFSPAERPPLYLHVHGGLQVLSLQRSSAQESRQRKKPRTTAGEIQTEPASEAGQTTVPERLGWQAWC